ncbi:hypothetical protein RRG08_028338 [Elysia crispata]|uniref:Uncharacterized protein n=1 Tax=Elysia crispata TaxID=231223 RepID=A0AAE1E5V6_9GAST|nr:hypothetical protein RRG08_028338 [Elysia crispata]
MDFAENHLQLVKSSKRLTCSYLLLASHAYRIKRDELFRRNTSCFIFRVGDPCYAEAPALNHCDPLCAVNSPDLPWNRMFPRCQLSRQIANFEV